MRHSVRRRVSSSSSRGLLGRQHQGLQGSRQWRFATEEPIDHDCVIVRRQHSSQLPPTTITLVGKVPCTGTGGFFPAGHAGPIDIQHLQTAAVVVVVAPTVAAIDGVYRLVPLRDIGVSACVQCLLHHRLFGARLPPKRRLQARIRPQALVDFDQPMRTRQEGDKRIVQFLDRGVFHLFLGTVP